MSGLSIFCKASATIFAGIGIAGLLQFGPIPGVVVCAVAAIVLFRFSFLTLEPPK